jgi:hypothetical protein
MLRRIETALRVHFGPFRGVSSHSDACHGNPVRGDEFDEVATAAKMACDMVEVLRTSP